MNITTKDFGAGYTSITITNLNSLQLTVSDLGARITSLKVPTSNGLRELILGFDTAKEYLEKDLYIGASIGRVAGRIRNGTFQIDGEIYKVQVDEKNGNTLHGGTPGFESKKWQYCVVENNDETSVIFHMVSPHDENGFPGNLDIDIRYTLTNTNVWKVETRATSDKDTLFNPTNHVYFNLTGDVAQPVNEHTLWVDSDRFAPLDSEGVPIGVKLPVEGTAFDFRKPVKLKETFSSNFVQKELVGGIDHPFFLNQPELSHSSVKLTSPDEVVSIEVATEEPSVVIFTANFGGNTPLMHGKQLANHGGITFETQVCPGAEQFSNFGDMVLRADSTYQTATEFHII
ncbi:galactose-1-epimerase [Bacillus wiedmannii]|uniref:galactose-1-epimerase n=1 Tax=Bacillus wiedmannii TaxID=1890302 RepID=UPI0021CF46A9|nr:galactose-1-epimerase [Bacillus wiedmannii]MCU5684936.1 galactose-1-epimerase [Bacillus wiedmannii]